MPQSPSLSPPASRVSGVGEGSDSAFDSAPESTTDCEAGSPASDTQESSAYLLNRSSEVVHCAAPQESPRARRTLAAGGRHWAPLCGVQLTLDESAYALLHELPANAMTCARGACRALFEQSPPDPPAVRGNCVARVGLSEGRFPRELWFLAGTLPGSFHVCMTGQF